MICLQALITDNTPVYIAGGTVVPISAGGVTTEQAKNAPVTLIAALAKASAISTPDRCSGPCDAQPVRAFPCNATILLCLSGTLQWCSMGTH